MSKLTLEQVFQIAVRHHQAGHLPQAENLYRQILDRQPEHADALHLLGVIAHQLGQNEIAAGLVRQAIALRPNFSDAYSNLGNVLTAKGRLGEAITAYRQAIALKPDYPDANYNLGNALRDEGHLDEAIAAYRQAIALKPDYPEAHSNLGNVLTAKGRLGEAITAYRQAIALKPDYPEAHSNLGNVLTAKGRLGEAITAYRQAIALKPDYPEAHSNLGNALRDEGQLDEAIAAYRQAIALKPDYPEAHSNLGNALRDEGQLDEAIAAYRQAIALKPDYPEAHSNLGNALRDEGQLDEAIAAYRQAIALKPDYPEAHSNLGNALRDEGQLDEAIAAYRQAIALKPLPEAHSNLGVALKDKGQLDEAIAAFRKAIALKPEFPEAESNLVYTLHLHPDYAPWTIAEEHRHWNRRHAEPLKRFIQDHTNDRNPHRRLLIGYVSPDFRDHPVGNFLMPLLTHHDRQSFKIFAYAQVPAPDPMTQRLRLSVDRWRSIVGLSDGQVADLIRQDQIDILVDLSGHTASSRILVFARLPAPVQVTYLGYPDTTGLTAIGYRLTDAYADPPGRTERYHSEQLIRLSPCAWCFSPKHSPSGTKRREGPVTFGSFNNYAKVTEPMLKLWCRVLRAVPGSRLLLKGAGLGTDSARWRVRRLLIEQEIDSKRLELYGHEPGYYEHLDLYSRMDIALDTFPYHGTTTTCEALWMGVPVVSLAGPSHVSRVGVSLLNNVGLAELVADSEETYVQIAVELANDPRRLESLRSTLRQRMEHSPLMDAPRFAHNIEMAYRQIWRIWCETPAR